MSSQPVGPDPAFNKMVLNVLRNVLSHAANPGDLGDYLTEEILEITGARCILFVQNLQTQTEIAYRVVSVRPVRHYRWAESEEMRRFYKIACAQPVFQVWRAEDSSESLGFLLDRGYRLSASFPLLIGTWGGFDGFAGFARYDPGRVVDRVVYSFGLDCGAGLAKFVSL
jgi:hypothetical protein